ncbi:Glucose/arabinose dehydrogenase, beta-propeller fold [Chitinophaga sp. YR627]|uniref:PQQ-dependent sugar dehydrogenase n=1 Tax=Chitinophaga sp. YR627 TaxID=1881041 RepID=UPI0008E41948|nr:PQQ-dependent sugar dehydrogenase [Chitinophaga sp. YR627]SFN21527.1 Glucose/arabinose dehydrogenase, beta-propeller fold [Chitinophaga sp. YR627]
MKNLLLILTASATLALHACSDDNEGSNDPKYPPVETQDPNTDYQPAFQGQTRAAGVRTDTRLDTTVITSSLQGPWSVKSLPDGRFLVTEKRGVLRIVTQTGTLGDPITGLPAVNSNGQGGLLGLTLDPAFSTNRMVYWTFSENVAGGTVTAVAKGRLANNDKAIENAVVIYRAVPAYNGTLHYGSRIVFDAQGNLFVSTGERSDLATRPLAQSTTAALGKIVHITKDGQPAPGNPTFGEGGLPELYTIGHRNPQGLAIHPVTGDLWQAEHGPRGGDEINHIQAGKNYGWPTITYGIEYSGQKVGDGIQQKEGLEQPVYYWDPVVSPSGMTFYGGDRVPEWKNNLFIGALSGQHIVRLVIENNKVVGEERLLGGEGQRFRDVTQGVDGALYAVTDQGRLYRLDKAE